jgi:hypothetical protein
MHTDQLRVLETAASRANGDADGTAFWQGIVRLALACEQLAARLDSAPRDIEAPLSLARWLMERLPEPPAPVTPDRSSDPDPVTVEGLLMNHAHALVAAFRAPVDTPDLTPEVSATVAELADLLARWHGDPSFRARLRQRTIDVTKQER